MSAWKVVTSWSFILAVGVFDIMLTVQGLEAGTLRELNPLAMCVWVRYGAIGMWFFKAAGLTVMGAAIRLTPTQWRGRLLHMAAFFTAILLGWLACVAHTLHGG